MRRRKWKQIEERIELIGKRLVDAADYVSQNVNVESSYLHFSDWRGKSGHPVWMRNVMIPRSMKWREELEKKLMKIDNKAKDKNLTMRKQPGATGDGTENVESGKSSLTQQSGDDSPHSGANTK